MFCFPFISFLTSLEAILFCAVSSFQWIGVILFTHLNIPNQPNTSQKNENKVQQSIPNRPASNLGDSNPLWGSHYENTRFSEWVLVKSIKTWNRKWSLTDPDKVKNKTFGSDWNSKRRAKSSILNQLSSFFSTWSVWNVKTAK